MSLKGVLYLSVTADSDYKRNKGSGLSFVCGAHSTSHPVTLSTVFLFVMDCTNPVRSPPLSPLGLSTLVHTEWVWGLDFMDTLHSFSSGP